MAFQTRAADWYLPSPPGTPGREGLGVRGAAAAENSRFRAVFRPPSPRPSPPGVPGGEGARSPVAHRKAFKPLAIIAFALLLLGVATSTNRADEAVPQGQIQFKKVSNFVIPPVLESSARGQEQN